MPGSRLLWCCYFELPCTQYTAGLLRGHAEDVIHTHDDKHPRWTNARSLARKHPKPNISSSGPLHGPTNRLTAIYTDTGLNKWTFSCLLPVGGVSHTTRYLTKAADSKNTLVERDMQVVLLSLWQKLLPFTLIHYRNSRYPKA